MSQEEFPLNLECVVVFLLFRHFLPAVHEVDRLFDIRIPDRAWSIAVVLCPHIAQANDSRALGAVDLHGE